jgi:ATP-dependent Clp protease, protease subunit
MESPSWEDIFNLLKKEGETWLEWEENMEKTKVTPEQEIIYRQNSGAVIEDNILLVTDVIDEDMFNSFLIGFRYLEKRKCPINIIVNTGGGDLTAMFSMYDMIRAASVPVTTIGTGAVCSAGVLLLVCAPKRYVTENCTLMSHQGSYDAGGRFDELESRMKFAEWSEKRWTELMARHTPRDAAYWKRVSKKDAELWVLGGEAIVEAGLADEVLTKPLVKILEQ